MHKLIFKLNPRRNMGLSFSLHTGSQMSLAPGQQLPYNIREEEPLTEQELINWYDSRYKSSGLSTRFLRDQSISTVVSPETSSEATKEEIKESQEGSTEHEQGSTKVPVVTEDETSTEKPGISTQPEEAPVEEDSSVSDDDNVEGWPFTKMRQFVSDNDIELDGRDKAAYVEAIKEFLAKK